MMRIKDAVSFKRARRRVCFMLSKTVSIIT